MDDLAHEFPLNHRKRKADPDDCPDAVSSATDAVAPQDGLLVDTTSVATTGPSNAPRQSWLASDTDTTMWPSSPTSPQVSSPLSQVMFNTYQSSSAKRPRLEKIETSSRTSGRRPSRKSPAKVVPPRPPPTVRQGSDIEDIGIVSTADPGPSSGSLLHLRSGPMTSKSNDSSFSSVVPFVAIDFNSIHIPSPHSLINRQTLKELDLDAILRSPQLRHDLLFDPGLQFRPTCSRRKRDMSEKYWNAIIQEVETGCTCVSFDLLGKPHSVVCACAQITIPTSNPVIAFSPSLSVLTLRMPSRIHSLLNEFLEVLLLVIQPLSSISGMYVNPNTFRAQMQEHSTQAAYIRSVFDPALIEQELKHELFDPSGLFRAIGLTLKGHCAPMRDRAVEAMVHVAQACTPEGSGTKADAVKAVRMCMEILELMKLDIANHQLQTLRPFLIRTSGQFELKTFKNRKGSDSALQLTREWLRKAHSDLLARGLILHPLYPFGSLRYEILPRNKQIYLATLRGLLDLVFYPPPSTSSSSSILPTPVSAAPSLSPAGNPETCYLDSTRLALLNKDAADITALYIFLLLYRQLVFSTSSGPSSLQDAPLLDESDMMKLKTEIRDIGSSKLGYCFSSRYLPDCADSSHSAKYDRKEAERWHSAKQDIVLQIAKRAKEARHRSNTTPRQHSSIGEAPDEQLLNLAQRWADSNIQPGSPLSVLLRRRLSDAVFNGVVALVYPPRDSPTSKPPSIDFLSTTPTESTAEIPLGAATGLESLTQEICSLAEKVSRLALVHLNAFLPLYEQEGFLALRSP